MILFDNPTDKWICNRCHEERDEAPLGDWDRCWNCDGDVWVAPHYRAWRKEPPTETGWYWAYSSQQKMVMVLRVDLLHPIEKLVPMWGSDVDDWKYFTHWLGPLPMPAPPEEE